ncbi:protein-L-isoaspartate(D-aspartate) O-methyltransferase [Candidatus Bipolaricaulota bacterium]
MDREWDEQRETMMRRDLRGRGIHDKLILTAMSVVPRHRFVPPEYQHDAYSDAPLPIGEEQTISQPYMVALMTEALRLAGGERVLEIGTGSGYQTAVLAEMGASVWTIERSAALSAHALSLLEDLGYESIQCLVRDGTLGLPSAAPFDRILTTGSLPEVPTGLLSQLTEGGIFVGPIGSWHSQDLVRIVYHADQSEREVLCACRFVPLIGQDGWQ